MMEIFKKFGQSARQVLLSAQKIAESMGGGIESEHILLGITVVPKTLAYDILKEHVVSADQLRLVMSLQPKQTKTTSGLSSETKKIFKKAVQAAAKYHHHSVEVEHLLFAILSDKNSSAYQLIAQTGVDPEVMKRQIEYIFSDIAEVNKILDEDGELVTKNGFIGNKPVGVVSKTKTKKATPAVDYFTTNLVKKAREGKIDPVVGREKEISRAIQILCRRTKNNPVFIGEPGVGKTALVEGLAHKIVSGEVPDELKNKKIVTLDLSLLVAGTVYRGQFEERIKKLLEEILNDPEIIIFIDELHNVVGAGSAEGSIDAANILKPVLTKGELRLIGATTADEYRKYIEKDAALERRLQPILIDEPDTEETVKILEGLKEYYENFHQVKITPGALRAAVELSVRYITDRFLPDKAIDLIDEAAAAAKVAASPKIFSKRQKLESQLKNIREQKDIEVERENFELAAKLRDEEKKLVGKLKSQKYEKETIKTGLAIDAKDIAKIVSVWTGVPVEDLVQEEKERFLNLEKELSHHILAQDEAIRELSGALRRNKSGLSDLHRPIGSFIFLGPTGVGKTELAKVLAREVYGKEDALIKIDMSEFMERHNISRLVGAPPGYVGYEESGKLTEAVRRHPYSVVLFDEIEKAHPEFFNLMLQVLDDGYLTDARGRKINFRNTVVILTSNLGTKEFNRQAKIGFATSVQKQQFADVKERVLEKVKEYFLPEFLNRVDKIIVFNPLSEKSLINICKLQLDQLAEQVHSQKQIKITFDAQIFPLIVKKYSQPEYGARPLRRAIADEIASPLSEFFLAAKKRLTTIKTTLKNNKIVFDAR